jgi:hypothetical protein
MSYQTLEVDLENGRVRPRGTDELPVKARALLTIVEESPEDIQDKNPPGICLAERVRHLAGIGSGEFTDLSTNKEHLNDLGR